MNHIIASVYGVGVANGRRGRPPVLEEEVLRTRALGVVVEQGYENVTMSDVAGALGLSVRTLHRHFPTKADIVWGPMDHSFEALHRSVESASAEMPAIEVISSAVVSAFGDSPAEGAELRRARLRLIAVTPELHQARSVAFMRWRGEIARFLGRRLDVDPRDLVPATNAAAIQSTIMAALAWWARTDAPGSPGDAVARALGGLAVLLETG